MMISLSPPAVHSGGSAEHGVIGHGRARGLRRVQKKRLVKHKQLQVSKA